MEFWKQIWKIEWKHKTDASWIENINATINKLDVQEQIDVIITKEDVHNQIAKVTNSGTWFLGKKKTCFVAQQNSEAANGLFGEWPTGIDGDTGTTFFLICKG